MTTRPSARTTSSPVDPAARTRLIASAMKLGPLEVPETARAAPPATGTPSPHDLMLDGLATRFVEGYPAGAPTLQRALSEYSRSETDSLGDTAWVWLAVELWDADAWFEIGTRQVQAARDAGALTVHPLALHTIAAWHGP